MYDIELNKSDFSHKNFYNKTLRYLSENNRMLN